MVKIRKYANGIERFLHGEKGQRFFNFAYSIGAAIVIWGALFKILHLPGGSMLLCIGMGTEIAMFILTAFDRPPKEYAWEEVFPVLDTKSADDRPDFSHGPEVIVNGSAYPAGEYNEASGGLAPVASAPAHSGTGIQAETALQMADAAEQYLASMQDIAAQMNRLNETTEALNRVSESLLRSYESITGKSEDVAGNSNGYVDQMEALNRNIQGLNTIYEIQLKSVSSQIETIDRVNRGLKDIRDMYEKSANESSRYCEETEKMARYMKQLNSVYEKMITAMTINMANPMMGGAPMSNPFESNQNNNID